MLKTQTYPFKISAEPDGSQLINDVLIKRQTRQVAPEAAPQTSCTSVNQATDDDSLLEQLSAVQLASETSFLQAAIPAQRTIVMPPRRWPVRLVMFVLIIASCGLTYYVRQPYYSRAAMAAESQPLVEQVKPQVNQSSTYSQVIDQKISSTNKKVRAQAQHWLIWALIQQTQKK